MRQTHSVLSLRRAGLLALGGATLPVGLGASPALAMDHGSSGGGCSPGVVVATSTPIFAHIEKAHLERSMLAVMTKP